MELWLLLILIACIGFVASFIGAVMGGAGLITIPFMIMFGLPPQVAIATNKIGIFGMGLGALHKYWKAKKIVWNLVIPLSVIGIIGAFIGSNTLVRANPDFLSRVVGVIILIMLPFVFLKKGAGIAKKIVSTKKRLLGYALFLIAAFWSGLFGGGAGIFYSYIYIGLFGLTFLQFKGTNRIPLTILNAVAIIVFAINGFVNILYAAVIFPAMALGSYAGAHVALKKGNAWIKGFYIVFVVVSAIKLIFF